MSGDRPQSRALRKVPRWVHWTVVPLLILVPVGYVIVSAEQSRDSGQNKEESAAATHLTWDWPTKAQRRIYQVPIPLDWTRKIAYLETNTWDTGVLYVQFQPTPGGLDTFLAQVGISRSALKSGAVTITPKQAKVPGWSFGPGHQWAGVSRTQHGDKPDHDITVDLTDPENPVVYVVSTINF
ncbi:hypothetical protein QMK19_18680 [Streptomyces sp. H10-C2]|uniref:hypothetical protein n=1 Tax=unclassified Streptomyces TaxID=2593676 RepID=UPI0024BA12F0|nr:MULTISPECIES: hypothetical protein [unclassified Streptomyces]MDJ0340814.1 hypothetical protein [Streptomyces sp. PH10-H1]MDJ0371654.1 hypothetical protein [Streptomyces sp. H10-C2]